MANVPPAAQGGYAASTVTLLSPFFRLSPLVQSLVLGVCYMALALFGILLTRETGRIAMIWLPNAVLLGILLQCSPANRLYFYVSAYAGNIAANLLAGDPMHIALGLALMNTAEVAIASRLLLRLRPELDISKPSDALVFVAIAGVVAPAVAAILATVYLHFAVGASIQGVLKIWFCADALGLLVVTPLLISRTDLASKSRDFFAFNDFRFWLLQSANLIVGLAIFIQSDLPLLFLAFPPLMIVSFYAGIRGAAVAGLTIAVTAIAGTYFGWGPVNLVKADLAERIFILQGFIATCLLFALHSASLVSEQRRLEANLRRLGEEAERANNAKSDFLSTMSHELRTPLTSIIGAIKLFVKGHEAQLNTQAKSLLDIALKNSNRLLQMINDILEIARIEAGKLKVENIDTELAPIIQSAVSAIGSYRPEKGVEVICINNSPNVHAWVDPLRLEQVLSNLLSNAIKVSPEQSAVTLSCVRRGSGKVRIEIVDKGPGVPEELVPRMFQKFEQGDTGNMRTSTGSGLGLCISKALIEAMAGDIGFRRSDANETVFYIDLLEAPQVKHEAFQTAEYAAM